MASLLNCLCEFLDASPTPYHAVAQIKKQLAAHGFTPLLEADAWHLARPGKYYIERRNASIIAFKTGRVDPLVSGVRLIGAHTDSPTLKVKPRPELHTHGYGQLGIEVYGGVLLNPWFDRDLSLAGRVSFTQGEGLAQTLVDFKSPIAVIPSLAIHLDRAVNGGREVNPQTQMRPILWQGHNERTLRGMLAAQLQDQFPGLNEADGLEYDLCFYDTQPAACIGVDQDFIASARLDNLLSCFAGLRALCDSDDDVPAVLALYDHEEVGSQSDIGANSNLLPTLFERLYPDVETRHRVLAKSCLFSVDNAHGIHPNFPSKHDDNHAPRLNGGPVIKVDAGQGYATSADTAAIVRWLATQANVPVQSYVTRADTRCGSTIGPMSAAKTGIKTVDLGLATFAMHSVRELGGARDIDYMHALLKTYLNTRSISW